MSQISDNEYVDHVLHGVEEVDENGQIVIYTGIFLWTDGTKNTMPENHTGIFSDPPSDFWDVKI